MSGIALELKRIRFSLSDSHVAAAKITFFFGGGHIGAGDNNVSNHSEPYDKDNILHRLFSLEKIVEMPKSCCVKNCSNSTKNNENVRFYLLPKENVRRKLRNAIRQVCIDKDGNIDNKRI